MHKIVPILSQLAWRTIMRCSALVFQSSSFSFAIIPTKRSTAVRLASRLTLTTGHGCWTSPFGSALPPEGLQSLPTPPISKSQTNCWGLSMTYPLPVRILYPLVTPSFQWLGQLYGQLSSLLCSSSCPLLVPVSAFSDKSYRRASGWELKFSCKTWRYSFSQRLRTLSGQVFKYLSHLVISSLPFASSRFSSR